MYITLTFITLVHNSYSLYHRVPGGIIVIGLGPHGDHANMNSGDGVRKSMVNDITILMTLHNTVTMVITTAHTVVDTESNSIPMGMRPVGRDGDIYHTANTKLFHR